MRFTLTLGFPLVQQMTGTDWY